MRDSQGYLIHLKNQNFRIIYFGYILRLIPILQKSIALLELQYFSADGFSLCELPVHRLMAAIHSKVDIFPFYLLPVIQN